MNLKSTITVILLAVAITPACKKNSDFERAVKSITIGDLTRQVAIVAADSFMGRQPFTEGETITIQYLASELERIGYEPAFGNSWFQEVPMTEILSEVIDPVTITTGRETMVFNSPDDIAVTSPHTEELIKVTSSEVVFAGFGIVAPEYGWNDYQYLDVKGKTVIVLVNDPGLYTGNPELFRGKEMTYYGRWTYKFEEAARQGAEGILIIHETTGAGYEYTIPRKSSISPRLQLSSNEKEEGCSFTGWLSASAADELFSSMGMNVSTLRQEACIKDFPGFETGALLDLTISNHIQSNISSNVAGILKGRVYPDEVIVYTAHWDHFGVGEPENGDSIYNGAVDNGTSMAWALEIAEAFTLLSNRPERSILILFPTAEEQGLLGSSWYAANPVFDPELTVACFNNDLLLPVGRMRDVMVTGYGQSDLDSLVAVLAGKQDRYILPDPNPHTGMYFRSDHFPFAARGIPAMFARGNCDSRVEGKEWAAEQELDYLNNRYHRPADNYDPVKWDFAGIREDATLMFEAGFILANSRHFPRWNSDSEFSRIRERDRLLLIR
jgi:Zn-dependent M28 family amino/carboxypeptidase